MPQWIGLRFSNSGRTTTRRAPFDPETTDALVRASRTTHRGSFKSGKLHHSVYVVLLELGAGEYELYVGSTGLTPEQRFANHKAGYKDSRWVRRFGVGLLPALYRHLNPLDYSDASRVEVALAEALRRTGIRVKQG